MQDLCTFVFHALNSSLKLELTYEIFAKEPHQSVTFGSFQKKEGTVTIGLYLFTYIIQSPRANNV